MKMNDLRKAAEMALERLESHEYWMDEEAIKALRQALAQPQEWKHCRHCGFQYRPPKEDKWHPLAQPERKWVDISTEELIDALEAANLPSIFSYRMACKVALDIAKDKNYTTTQHPDEFCTATTEELMKELGCSDKKAKEIHDKAEALAQPEQEPVGYVTIETISSWAKVPSIKWFKKPTQGPLYTAPPKREWVGLTRRELDIATLGLEDLGDCYKAIEAKLKEKNT